MKFTITVHADNEAFSPDPSLEIARLLRKVAAQIEDGLNTGGARPVFDINGNHVGEWVWT